MGFPISQRGSGWITRSQFAAPSAASADASGGGRRGRVSPPPALHWPADAPNCASAATISRILRRLGLNRLAALEPAEPVRRYEREHPGELIHIDIKKLGRFNRVGHRITGDRRGQSNSRGVGWEYVHVCIDDASRIAYAEIKKSERKASAIAFLKAAVIYYAKLGISIQRVMTDNGSQIAPIAIRRGYRGGFSRPKVGRANAGRSPRLKAPTRDCWPSSSRAGCPSRRRAPTRI